MYLVFWIIVLMLILPSSTKEECLSSGDSTLCCADFYEVDGKCTPCPSGYFGPSCSHTCPYPKYGRRCLEGECQCPESMCDSIAGCVTEKSETVENNNHLKQEPKASVLNVDNEQKTENVVKNDFPEKDTSSAGLVAVAIIGAFIIIALSAVLTVQVIKGRINIRPKTLSFKRQSHVTNQRHVDTYCDIDESNMEEADCKLWSESEAYESIDHSKKDAIKYTALPSRSEIAKERATTCMSTVSMKKKLHDDAGAQHDNAEKDESKVQMREDKNRHRPIQKRIGKTSTKISGYIDMAKNKLESYVSMTAENIEPTLNDQN